MSNVQQSFRMMLLAGAFVAGMAHAQTPPPAPVLPPQAPSSPTAAHAAPELGPETSKPPLAPAVPAPIPAALPQPAATAMPQPPATPTASPTEAQAQAEAPAPTRPVARSSLGIDPISLFFTPNQLRLMGDALEAYESTSTNAPHATDVSIEAVKDLTPKIVEPETYPVFYLSSIAYRTADDWSIWVSGHKITSRKNTTSLTVIAVSPDRATLSWSPTYGEALVERKRRSLFAPVDPVKNKLTRPSTYSYDETTGTVTFTLKPNQSFAAGYMNTFEGFIQSPKLTPLDNKAATTGKDIATPATAAPSTAPASAALGDRKPATLTGNIKDSRSEIDAQLKRQDPPTLPLPPVAPPAIGTTKAGH